MLNEITRKNFKKNQDDVLDIEFDTSILICVKNAEQQIKSNLPYFLRQKKLKELVIVDDYSTDNTWSVLSSFTNEYPNLKIFKNTNTDREGKKLALRFGLNQINSKYVLLSDIDCIPNSDSWYIIMNQNRCDKDVVLGYSPQQKRTGFLNKLIRYDTFHIAVHYLSMNQIKKPMMGVGRNMLIDRELYLSSSMKGENLASGDDDLFVQTIKDKNIGFEINQDAFVVTTPKITFKDWVNQKTRHTTTFVHYSIADLCIIGIIWLSKMAFCLYVLTQFYFIITDFNLYILLYTAMLILFYTLFTNNLYSKWLEKMDEKDLKNFIPILDFIYIFVQPIFVLRSLVSKNKWN